MCRTWAHDGPNAYARPRSRLLAQGDRVKKWRPSPSRRPRGQGRAAISNPNARPDEDARDFLTHGEKGVGATALGKLNACPIQRVTSAHKGTAALVETAVRRGLTHNSDIGAIMGAVYPQGLCLLITRDAMEGLRDVEKFAAKHHVRSFDFVTYNRDKIRQHFRFRLLPSGRARFKWKSDFPGCRFRIIVKLAADTLLSSAGGSPPALF